MDTGMALRRVVAAFLLALLVVSTPSAHATTAAGIDWLLSAGRADGALAGSSERTSPFHSTDEALLTLRAVGSSDGAVARAALDYLVSAQRHNTERLARSIRLAAARGAVDPTEVELLVTARGRSFGYGERAGSDETLLDTTYALEALSVAGERDGAAAWDALLFLLDRQRTDGGWGEDGVAHARAASYPQIGHQRPPKVPGQGAVRGQW